MQKVLSNPIHGWDPLSSSVNDASVLQTYQKRIIENILKCYTGTFDIFSEIIQNSLDAIDNKRSKSKDFEGKIWIEINIQKKRIRIVDNGCGMNLDEFKFFLAPNISFKDQAINRGQKGVGATFLAYGYSFIHAQSKTKDKVISGVLREGRKWIEDEKNIVPKPTFHSSDFNVPELEGETSGTAIEIIIGDHEGERPKDLGWMGAQTATQWAEILRIKTPLGGFILINLIQG